MRFNENHLSYQTTGRYFTYGNPETAKHLLIALHGYGQLTPYFIRKFEVLDKNDFFVICPEGPHRFYLQGTSGRVGASWMTKEDRLTDIQDYITFLNTLWQDITNRFTFEKKTLLGFSQGGATASRWLAKGNGDFDQFILWAAVYPPDMDTNAHDLIKQQRNLFVLGTEDEFISMEAAEKQINHLKNNHLDFEFVTFKGKHVIHADTLKKIL